MLGLTNLGILHTLIGIISLVIGVQALIRYKEIVPQTRPGMMYIAGTALTSLTGLGIFQHGGFGPPHALSIMTLVVLVVGLWIAHKTPFGRFNRYAQALCFSTTFLFHAIPSFTETLVRIPVGKPLMSGPDDPAFKPLYATLFLLYFIGLAVQARWLKGQARVKPAGAIDEDLGVAG
jgi:uncharacterized membrane protein